jgi:hypothetical protein
LHIHLWGAQEAEEVNKSFTKKLSKVVAKEKYITLFEYIMKDHHQKSCKEGSKAAS